MQRYDHELAGDALLKTIRRKWQQLVDGDGINFKSACSLCTNLQFKGHICRLCPLFMLGKEGDYPCTILYAEWNRHWMLETRDVHDAAVHFYLFLCMLYHEYWGKE